MKVYELYQVVHNTLRNRLGYKSMDFMTTQKEQRAAVVNEQSVLRKLPAPVPAYAKENLDKTRAEYAQKNNIYLKLFIPTDFLKLSTNC